MPRFVLLRHECPPNGEKPSHWDFMLEADGVLWTWKLQELPGPWAAALGLEVTSDSDDVVVTRLADHRLEYLDYQGPVSGNRGHVSRVDAGEFQWIQQSPSCLDAELTGNYLLGAVSLTIGVSAEGVLHAG